MACPGPHDLQTSGFFLRVPSPEHGTSHNIRSNSNGCCLPVFYESKQQIQLLHKKEKMQEINLRMHI